MNQELAALEITAQADVPWAQLILEMLDRQLFAGAAGGPAELQDYAYPAAAVAEAMKAVPAL